MSRPLLSGPEPWLPAVLEAWQGGQLTDAEARRARALCGLHQLRGGLWMLRLKAPGGRVSPGQWRRLAEALRAGGPGLSVHLTSRQAVELHGLSLASASAASASLAGAGWTSRGSGGDGVRNLAVPARCGLEPGDAFDPLPWALAFGAYFQGRAEFEALPRKFKVAFTTPLEAAPGAWFHDLAFIADPAEGWEPGFRVLAGGGLGAAPSVAQELKAFVPARDVLRLAAAVLRVWSQRSSRERGRSRLKHWIRAVGIDEFRREVEDMLQRQADPGDLAPAAYRAPQGRGGPWAPLQGSPEYRAWLQSNARPQAGGGWYALVRTRQGRLDAAELEGLAGLAEELGLEELRLSARQQVYLPGLDTASLPQVHARLRALGLDEPGADRLVDVCACPGPQACQQGLADPRGLAGELSRRLASGPAAAQAASLRISGCGNSCCHHRAADLGLQGQALRQDGRWYPAFRFYAGGGGSGQQALGRELASVPAARVPEALERVLGEYSHSGEPGEGLRHWLRRRGSELAPLLEPFRSPDPEQPAHFREWGSDKDFSPYPRGQAQC